MTSYISVYGLEPDLTREGGSIPITLTLEEASGRNVMLLPIGSGDDGAHSQNEKINKTNYLKGVSRYRPSQLCENGEKTRISNIKKLELQTLKKT